MDFPAEHVFRNISELLVLIKPFFRWLASCFIAPIDAARIIKNRPTWSGSNWFR